MLCCAGAVFVFCVSCRRIVVVHAMFFLRRKKPPGLYYYSDRGISKFSGAGFANLDSLQYFKFPIERLDGYERLSFPDNFVWSCLNLAEQNLERVHREEAIRRAIKI